MNAPKARKTYVVNYYDGYGRYFQEYFQNKKQAQRRANQLGMDKGKAHLSHWIDGVEMIRLARLGYTYDSSVGKVRKSKHAKSFVDEIDSLPKNVVESKFLDYRMFKNLDDVLEFHKSHRI